MVPPTSPKFPLEAFLKACRDTPDKIYITRSAVETAADEFELQTHNDRIAFVLQRFESPFQFQRSARWDNLSDAKGKDYFCDSYICMDGKMRVYVSFGQGANPKWEFEIKSLKGSDR